MFYAYHSLGRIPGTVYLFLDTRSRILTGFSHGKNGRSRGRRNAASYHATGQPAAAALFSDDDYKAYIDLMSQWCGQYAMEIWAYCLMSNHIHLIAVPQEAENLRLTIGEAHRRYTRRINFARGRRGHLWQERFSSFVMDEQYLMACVRPPPGRQFVEQLERSLGRKLAPQKPGRKPKKQRK